MRKPNERDRIRVMIYGKADCHLCEIAKKKIRQFHDEFSFEMIEVDITSDPSLYAQYAERIPLVFVNGHLVAKYRIDDKTFRKALKKAERGKGLFKSFF